MRKKTIIILTLMLLAAIITIWLVWGNLSIKTTRYQVSSQKLPDTFHNFRIVQISDLHNASFGTNNQRLLAKIRNSDPDIIVVTGDLVDYYHPDIDVSLSFIEEAVKIAPCYYVYGNHEARMPQDYPNIRRKLMGLGVTVLEDSSVFIEKEGQQICIAGLREHLSVSDQHINTILQDQTYSILLSHRPDHAAAFSASNADLVLCGHTHGGQLRLPFIGAVYTPGEGLFPQYDSGYFSFDDSAMIISQGLGNSSFPFRVNCRPEIVVIELNCK